jgi:transposase InsO family protein
MALRVMTLTQMRIEVLLAPDRLGISVAETCRRYGISRDTFYGWRRRYRALGLEGLEPRSKRPRRSPKQTSPHVEDLIVHLRKQHPRWGARKVRAALIRRGLSTPPAVSTVHAILRRHGLVAGRRRRSTSALKRFERAVPNDLWQIDAPCVGLSDGTKAWVIDVLDGHARFAIAALACRRATTTAAWACLEEAIRSYGAPRQLLSDNGLAFSGRLHGREVLFERNLRALGVQLLTSRPRHPQTCGKLERFHQTLKDWLADRGRIESVEQLQEHLDAFRWHYNVERPHESLGQTPPQERYRAREPAAGPHRYAPRSRRAAYLAPESLRRAQLPQAQDRCRGRVCRQAHPRRRRPRRGAGLRWHRTHP